MLVSCGLAALALTVPLVASQGCQDASTCNEELQSMLQKRTSWATSTNNIRSAQFLLTHNWSLLDIKDSNLIKTRAARPAAVWIVCGGFVVVALCIRGLELRARSGQQRASATHLQQASAQAEQTAWSECLELRARTAQQSVSATDLQQPSAQAEQTALDKASSPEHLPGALTIWPAIWHCASNVMFLSILPVAEDLASLANKPKGAGGQVVSAFGFGALISNLIFWLFGCNRVKSCAVAHAIFVLCGSIVYVMALVVLHLEEDMLFGAILTARLLYGCGAGINFTGSLALTSAMPPSDRTEWLGYWAGGGSVGMLLGPVISSMSQDATIFFLGSSCPARTRYSAQALLIFCYGALSLLAVAKTFPADELLKAHCIYGDNNSQKAVLAVTGHQSDALQVARARMGMFFCSAGVVLRTLVRVTWENSEILLLKFSYGMGSITSGYVVAGITFVYAVLQLSFGMCLRKMKQSGCEARDSSLLRFFEICTFIGLGIMMLPSLACFLLGSSILFFANALSGSPFLSFCTKLGSGSSIWLSTSNIMLVNNMSALLMFVFGPLYSSLLVSSGETSGVLSFAHLLLPALVCQLFMNEICTTGMEADTSKDKLADGDDVPFDIVMVMLAPTWCTRGVIEGVTEKYHPRAIHIIAPEVRRKELIDAVKTWVASPVHVHGEENFFPACSRQMIYGELQNKQGLYNLGWFYQQLLKLGAAEGIPGLSEWYLVWDADMLPLDSWPILTEGRHKFALVQDKIAGNPAIISKWHEWINTVLGVDVLTDDQATFVPHHMWFKQEHLSSFKAQVNRYFASQEHWAVLMMRSVHTFETFTEYWSYASWVHHQKPDDLAFHPYSNYGATNERFFDDGHKGLFSRALHHMVPACHNSKWRQSFSPSYVEISNFVRKFYLVGLGQPIPSSFNFEQSSRHLEKLEENMHAEETRSFWNPRRTTWNRVLEICQSIERQ